MILMVKYESAVGLAASAAAGYLFGTIASADLAASRASKGQTDLRDNGSANPGALNAGLTLGKKWGAAVMVADVAKGVAAASVGRALAGPVGANLAATAAVGGHCYPIGRTGGKGVSTSIGQVIGTFPVYLPLDLAVGIATAAVPRWTQRTWAATAVASATWVGSSLFAYRRGWATGIDGRATAALPLASLASSLVIAKRFLDTPLVDGKPRDGDRVHNEGTDRAERDKDANRSDHRFEQPTQHE
jgi:glycerol-3-phosphate acyltransferase PlsY